MKGKSMEITHDDTMIYFKPKELERLAYTNYDVKLLEKIESTSWHVKRYKNKDKEKEDKLYINSSKLSSLHRVVMRHWYGDDAMDEADGLDYVVDHLDNEGFNCLLENLCFIPRKKNSAKGLTYDEHREKAIDKLWVNIFKDFETKLFQITVVFKEPTYITMTNENVWITKLSLVYNDDFDRTLANADKILHDYGQYRIVDIKKLDHIKVEITKAIKYPDDGTYYQVQEDGSIIVDLASPHVHRLNAAPNNELYKQN